MSDRSIEQVIKDTTVALRKCKAYCLMTVNEDGRGIMYIDGSNRHVVDMANSLVETVKPAAMGLLLENIASQFLPKSKKKTKKKTVKKK